MTVFQSTNLTIRPCTPGDGADFIALERDPDVMRFLTGGQLIGQETSHLEGTFLQPRGTEPYVWTLRRSVSGAFVGWICLWPEDDKVAEIGYRLHRSQWGQGLASEAAAVLVEWGFRRAGYDKVIASTMTANRASRRVLEKIGMELVRTVSVDWAKDIPGGEQGEVHYELARSNWNAASDMGECT